MEVEFFWGASARYRTSLFLRKILSENPFNNKTVAVILLSIPNCCAKFPENVFFFSMQQVAFNLDNRNCLSSEPEKQFRNQILKYNFKMRQTLNQRLFKLSDFELKSVQSVHFQSKKSQQVRF